MRKIMISVSISHYLQREMQNRSLLVFPVWACLRPYAESLLGLVKDSWLLENSWDTLIYYISCTKGRLWRQIWVKHLLRAKDRIKGHFDEKAKSRGFWPGSKVLLYFLFPNTPFNPNALAPISWIKTLATGIFIDTPSRQRKTRYRHENLLKAYLDRLTTHSASPVLVNSVNL